jgi:hydroxymethylpyrimidine/phosphomethylpyrimidine kinase
MTAIALTIAGSDSGGGAGIQADLKAFSALGVYGCSVITALTAQNTLGVQGIFPVDPGFVREQMDSVFSDLAVDAVKIGMLGTPEVIHAVADGLERWRPRLIVLDPVMVAKGGQRLIAEEAVEALRARLLPLCVLVTPNLPEAGALLGTTSRRASGGRWARRRPAARARGEERPAQGRPPRVGLGEPRPAAARRRALLAGGRAGADPAHPRHGLHALRRDRGAAGPPQPLPTAVAEAKRYLAGAIAAAEELGVGHGHGPVHHFHQLWPHLEGQP